MNDAPHGPICIGLDNGCPDCKRIQAYQMAGHAGHEPTDGLDDPDAEFDALIARVSDLEQRIGIQADETRVLVKQVESLEARNGNDRSELCFKGDCAKMTGRARPCPIHDSGPDAEVARLTAEVQRLTRELAATDRNLFNEREQRRKCTWCMGCQTCEPLCLNRTRSPGPCVESAANPKHCLWCDRELRP